MYTINHVHVTCLHIVIEDWLTFIYLTTDNGDYDIELTMILFLR